MAEPTIYVARHQPSIARWQEMKAAGQKAAEYLVPVSWWAYADDRLDARCPATLNEAFVSVKAFDAHEARQLVWREWGDYAQVRTAVLREVAA